MVPALNCYRVLSRVLGLRRLIVQQTLVVRRLENLLFKLAAP